MLARRFSEDSLYSAQLTVATLRDWLQGRWGLLFSHPHDFASYGFEMDRWLVHTQQALAASRVAALAIANGSDAPQSSWINEIGGADIVIRWSDAHRIGGVMQARERSLISTVINQTTRFVLVIDESLRPRRTYAYSPTDRLASPIELAWMTHRLRERSLA
jgi:alkyl hydroperoxide reductase subunit AhpC